MPNEVIIGSARIDERGKATGGKSGDQTGKELSTQKWYKHDKGWRVFRAKMPVKAEMIAQDMQYACDNKHIGYDQNQRLTLYNVAKNVGFNCRDVMINCETDCSALVRVCCAYAGIELPNFNTLTEPRVLINSGDFIELTNPKYTDSCNYLKRGDILVTKTQGHTAVVLNDGKDAESIPTLPKFNHIKVTGGSVYVRTAPDKNTGIILGVVHKNDILDYQGLISENNWYLVVYKNSNGWISGKYSELIE